MDHCADDIERRIGDIGGHELPPLRHSIVQHIARRSRFDHKHRGKVHRIGGVFEYRERDRGSVTDAIIADYVDRVGHILEKSHPASELIRLVVRAGDVSADGGEHLGRMPGWLPTELDIRRQAVMKHANQQAWHCAEHDSNSDKVHGAHA